MRLEKVAETITCTTCGAQPGDPCLTLSGKRASMPHAPRMEPITAAYATGYLDAERYAERQPA